MNSQPVREDTDLQHHTDTDHAHSGSFQSRHIGPDPAARDQMLAAIGVPSLDALIEQTVPPDIRLPAPLDLPAGVTEYEYLRSLRGIAARNRVFRSYIGHGYYDCVTPAVILRNVLENPGWYTPYTPYQAEIAQGRLESLLNFQTMVRDLTGMDIATASLLDEGTAAAEAMTMFHRLQAKKAPAGQESIFVVSERCFAQTIDVLRGRAEPLEIKLVIGDLANVPQDVLDRAFGILAQYPDAHGEASDLRPLIGRAHDAGLSRRGRDRPPLAGAARSPGRNGRPTPSSATPRGSGCRWDMAARTPRSWRRETATSGRRRAGLSGCQLTPAASARIAWRCRPESSTSAAKRRPRTSARRRRSSPTSRRCMRSSTALPAFAR